jgi:hypothetical protein
MFAAIWLGFNLVTTTTDTLMRFSAILLLGICLLLGRRIWLLMVFFTALDIPLIRGLSTEEVGMMLFLGFSTLLFFLRKLPLRSRFGELEIWLLLLVACIIQAYIRNPVGLNIFGSATVGAKPYFLAALAFLSGLTLSVLVVPPEELKWIPRLTLIGKAIGIPISEYRVSRGLASLGADTGGGGETSRVSWLLKTTNALGLYLVSKMSPFQAIWRPLFLVLFLLCILGAAASGYRNTVASVGLLFLFGIFYHQGFFAMLASLVAGAVCIVILAGVNLVQPLPGTVQRALSPFPGTWERRYVEAAQNSTEWRVEMWKEALFTNRWIHNKTFGDGLGLSRTELKRIVAFTEGGRDGWTGTSGMTIQQENMMLTGGYHSGPVHTVRTIGYVGLAILLAAMIRLAVHAHRQIVRCRNTEWFYVALFVCLPLIILPIFWTFIFGEFDKGFASVALGIGFVRLLERNLPLPAFQRTSVKSTSPSYLAKGMPMANG